MRAAAGAVLMLVLAGLVPRAHAQLVTETTARCLEASGGASWCAAGAVAYQAVASGVGLAASGGSEIPGTSSTLGWRRGLGPRMALSARFTGARIPLPALDEASASRLPALRSIVGGASLDAAVGLFDGIRLAPLYGGILALDAVASVGILGLEREDGFQGNAWSAGLGVRLGILRESFDVPGISVSAVRRFLGEAGLGADGAPVSVRVEPVATSVRALIGKDVFTVGVLVGAGWDHYSGDVTIAGAATSGGLPGSVAFSGPAMDRLLFFGGVSRTWQVVQVNAEIGWGEGFDRQSNPTMMSFDPGAGSMFGSLILRLTR